ncbi:MAG: PLP-dependent aminotransferase family protein, partial [Eubacteriales bacterium]|nr:PLP-dependent aminotransferase family protein [Eubacteriales bacterium]
TPELNDRSRTPLYLQLYSYIRDSILERNILPGEKLPSLRSLARTLNLSVTTVELAYSQLLVEGYLSSKPQSGYFINAMPKDFSISEPGRLFLSPQDQHAELAFSETTQEQDRFSFAPEERGTQTSLYFDPASFDFIKWKKCTNAILTDYSNLLLKEGDPRGEFSLRAEISKYIYQARGVRCNREQVVIGAGTQQLISLLCIILQRMGIEHVSFEDPGYVAVRGIFKDRDFKMNGVPIDRDGILIEKLPVNIRSTVYLSPSNQFPTGSVMPVARRYALLDWAFQNNSIIIEDDYNSELRYDSRPVPSLQGLDNNEQVVYIGSFSSTLFPAIKISYMVLPSAMRRLFSEVLGGYTQTCSKSEQLTLALYMGKGYYQTNLKKLRKLYAQKILLATAAITRHGKGKIRVLNNSSGLHMLLDFSGASNKKTTEEICREAALTGLTITPVSNFGGQGLSSMAIFYYTRVPADKMEQAIIDLAALL